MKLASVARGRGTANYATFLRKKKATSSFSPDKLEDLSNSIQVFAFYNGCILVSNKNEQYSKRCNFDKLLDLNKLDVNKYFCDEHDDFGRSESSFKYGMWNTSFGRIQTRVCRKCASAEERRITLQLAVKSKMMASTRGARR